MELTRHTGQAAGAELGGLFNGLDISETTRKHYQGNIKLFEGHIEQNGLNFDSFLNYKRELEARQDFSISTKNAYLTAARVLLKEANRRGQLPADITANIKSFKQSKKHKRPALTQAEVKAILARAKETGDTRERALLALLTFQGLRQIEISRLDITDIDLANNTAAVQGKGCQDKENIDLHPESLKAISEYLQQEGRKTGPLFASRDRAHKGHRLTTLAIRQIAKRTLQELGIKKTIHSFRHYFTTQLLETFNGDLLKVSNYTRHKSIETLQIYDNRIRERAELPKFYGAFSGLVEG